MTSPGSEVRARHTSVQWAALIVGAVFVAAGLVGVLPGLTTDHTGVSGAVAALPHVIHLLFGVAGIALSRTVPAARRYVIAGGVISALLFVYGLMVDDDSSAGFVPVNNGKDWLRLILALGMLAVGLVLGPVRRSQLTG